MAHDKHKLWLMTGISCALLQASDRVYYLYQTVADIAEALSSSPEGAAALEAAQQQVVAATAAPQQAPQQAEAAAQQQQPAAAGKPGKKAAAAAASSPGVELLAEVRAALADDFNTPLAIAALSAPLKAANDLLHTKKVGWWGSGGLADGAGMVLAGHPLPFAVVRRPANVGCSSPGGCFHPQTLAGQEGAKLHPTTPPCKLAHVVALTLAHTCSRPPLTAGQEGARPAAGASLVPCRPAGGAGAAGLVGGAAGGGTGRAAGAGADAVRAAVWQALGVFVRGWRRGRLRALRPGHQPWVCANQLRDASLTRRASDAHDLHRYLAHKLRI